jgi:hypothetical protein
MSISKEIYFLPMPTFSPPAESSHKVVGENTTGVRKIYRVSAVVCVITNHSISVGENTNRG